MTWSNARTPKQGEIWLAHLHFAENPNVGKVRPVLILDSRTKNKRIQVVCLKVTSKHRDDGREDVAIKNWQGCGLRKPSYVRLDQVFEISQSELLRELPIGILDKEELTGILSYFE